MKEQHLQIPVSVILPVYNGGEYLHAAIESILSQTFSFFELIIVNDASKDNSAETIDAFKDGRIKVYHSPTNLGLVGALNKAIELSSGHYLMRMDQDDLSNPDRLKRQYEFLQHHPEYSMVGTRISIMGTQEIKHAPLTDEDIKAFLLFGSPFAHPSVMIRKSVLTENQLKYDETFKHAEDYGLWSQLAAFGKMANLDYVGLQYRLHPSQYTNVFSKGMADTSYKIRNHYLQMLDVKMPESDRVIFEMLANKQIDYSDTEMIKEIGHFLVRFYGYFEHTHLNQLSLRNLIYNKWKRICIDRAKAGFKSYAIYRASNISKWKKDVKLKIWLLKHALNPIARKTVNQSK